MLKFEDLTSKRDTVHTTILINGPKLVQYFLHHTVDLCLILHGVAID